MPDKTKPFFLETDASKVASGAVLRQYDGNGDLKPCGFISKAFDPTQQRYQIYDRELLGIIRGLLAWRHYLLGSPHTITIWCDHKNLTHFRTAQRLTPRQSGWQLILSQYDLQITHVPGTKMIQSDALSRRPDYGEVEIEETILLPESMFLRNIDIDLKDKIALATAEDPLAKDAIQAIKESGIPPLRTLLAEWKLKEGLVYFKDKVYIPENLDLRREILSKHHDLPVMGHPGMFKTLELVKRSYWWPGLWTFTKRFVDGCAICQQMKVNTHPTAPPLNPIPAAADALPFSTVTMDFITDLPASSGFDALYVVVDHDLSKGVVLIPCTKRIDALGTAQLYHDNVYKRFGLPQRIISDRGPQFASQVFQELCEKIGVKSSMSTAYHPQTDGQTERTNQEIEAYLRIYCGNHPEAWVEHLTDLEFSHNNRVHSVTKQTPFSLIMGYEPKAIPSANMETKAPALMDRLRELVKRRAEALAAHELARQLMADRIKKRFIPFKKGEDVWLEAKNLNLGNPFRKLKPKREGPFKILEVLSPWTYRIKLPSTWKMHPVFHASLLSHYRENDIHGPSYSRPPPDEIEGQPEYEVEAILNHKGKGNRQRYLVKWKGYETSENSWIPAGAFSHAKDILREYKERKHLPRRAT